MLCHQHISSTNQVYIVFIRVVQLIKSFDLGYMLKKLIKVRSYLNMLAAPASVACSVRQH